MIYVSNIATIGYNESRTKSINEVLSIMKIGDYVTTQEIANQNMCRWVVLSDFVYGEYGGIIGGIIKHIADTKTEAGNKELEFSECGIETILICGALQLLSVGSVFVE